MNLDWNIVDEIIDRAFAEDIGPGDATTLALFGAGEQAHAYMKVKDEGVIAGLPVAERVFRRLDPQVQWLPQVDEGQAPDKGTIIAEIRGSTRALLSGERLALNLLQRLSGIATMSRAYSRAVGEARTKILDTRKTLPGLRILEKYAVAVGGATNHRYGLFDGIMIKDNHILLAGGITEAVRRARANNPRGLSIEVETADLEQVREALVAGADIIMLDNMDNQTMAAAVRLIEGRAKVEASGGVLLERVASMAATGVDFISVGALTHSVRALDIGMYFY